MEIKKANTCVCMGCLEPILNGNYAESKPGCYYHRECVKPEKNHIGIIFAIVTNYKPMLNHYQIVIL